MYTLISSMVLPVLLQSKWKTMDLSTEIVSNIFRKYRKAVLTIQPDYQADVIYVDMEQFRLTHANYNNTLSVMLQGMAGVMLQTVETLPSERTKYVTYAYAHQADYHIARVSAGLHLPANAALDQLPDLVLTREKASFDLTLLHKYCLLSVNGFYHNTTADAEKSYVLEGGNSCVLGEKNAVGITSFRDVGMLTKIKITDAMITAAPTITALKDGLEITLPAGTNVKSFFLILGGYLVYPQDNVLFQTGDRTFRLNLYKLPYIDRLYESNNYIDLSPLQLTETEGWETVINTAEVWSDAVIRRYLMLSQSFMVLVDTDNLFFDKITLRQARLPGYFTANTEPEYPLFLGLGRIGEYWKRTQSDRWVLTMQDSFKRNPMYYHAIPPRLTHVAAQLAFDRPFYFSQGYLMEIGGYNNLGS